MGRGSTTHRLLQHAARRDRSSEFLERLIAGDTLQIIADAHGITRQRVHQILLPEHRKLIQWLRQERGLERVRQREARLDWLWKNKPALRFWQHVDIGGPDDCWLWQKGTDVQGYGALNWGGRKTTAHRVAWEIAQGRPMPPRKTGVLIMHLCEGLPGSDKRCCNPAHLLLADQKTNIHHAIRNGRHPASPGKHPGLGKKHTAETKAKISAALKARSAARLSQQEKDAHASVEVE